MLLNHQMLGDIYHIWKRSVGDEWPRPDSTSERDSQFD